MAEFHINEQTFIEKELAQKRQEREALFHEVPAPMSQWPSRAERVVIRMQLLHLSVMVHESEGERTDADDVLNTAKAFESWCFEG